jgi:hypothetical protein
MYSYIHTFLIDHKRKPLMQLYVTERKVVYKNSFVLRLKIALFGYAKLCEVENVEFYAFRCPVHGLTTDHARGHNRYLDCCYCRYD